MSTEIETKMEQHTATEFWGGDQRGVCLQITASGPMAVRDTAGAQLQEEGFIQVTMEEAAALCNALGGFVKGEAVRRQALLRDSIARAKMASRTVFHEVAALPDHMMAGPELAVMMVSRLCPRSVGGDED